MDNTVDNFTVVDITETKTSSNSSTKQDCKTSRNQQSNFQEDIELTLIDSAFSNVFESARPWKNYFIIQSHLFKEEELACCFDLAENFIKNRHSLALKLIIINRLEAYKSLDYEITAISKLTAEILRNLDAQLSIDDHLNSFGHKFSQICFENIFYRDLKDFEFSALSRIDIDESLQVKIRQEVFLAMSKAENRYQDSFTLTIDHNSDTPYSNKKKKRFDFIIIETEKTDLDFGTKFKLKCFETEFTDYIKNNALLLNEQELNSCEELAKEFIRCRHENNYQNLFNLLNIKKAAGEHLSSIICALIDIFAKLDLKLKEAKHLSHDLSKVIQDYQKHN
ncbi:MAG: hypothetical protein KGO93_02695 [Cyanobacteria bacterium REEB446]|nr:hypothetical protein [Cyanobacteria bacterium REEB446]